MAKIVTILLKIGEFIHWQNFYPMQCHKSITWELHVSIFAVQISCKLQKKYTAPHPLKVPCSEYLTPTLGLFQKFYHTNLVAHNCGQDYTIICYYFWSQSPHSKNVCFQ